MPEIEEHPLLDELRGLDVARMTPIDALVKLDMWKRQLAKEAEKEAR